MTECFCDLLALGQLQHGRERLSSVTIMLTNFDRFKSAGITPQSDEHWAFWTWRSMRGVTLQKRWLTVWLCCMGSWSWKVLCWLWRWWGAKRLPVLQAARILYPEYSEYIRLPRLSAFIAKLWMLCISARVGKRWNLRLLGTIPQYDVLRHRILVLKTFHHVKNREFIVV